jgi:hypothetical protein
MSVFATDFDSRKVLSWTAFASVRPAYILSSPLPSSCAKRTQRRVWDRSISEFSTIGGAAWRDERGRKRTRRAIDTASRCLAKAEEFTAARAVV